MSIGLVKVHGLSHFPDLAIRNNRGQKVGPGLVHRAVEKDISGGGPGNEIDRLIRDLNSENVSVRRNAASALASIGPSAISAIPALIKCLNDEYRDVRTSTVYALGEISPYGVSIISALTECLSDKDISVRLNAVYALGKIGPAAVPALISCIVNGKDNYVRERAINELEKIGLAAVPALINCLHYEDRDVRLQAIRTLENIAPAAPSVISGFNECLSDKDPYVRFQALCTLAKIGSAAAPAIPALINCLSDKDINVKYWAAKALENIGPAAAPAIPALAECIRRNPGQGDIINNVVDALAAIGPAAAPALAHCLSDKDISVRLSAVYALEKLGPATAPATAPAAAPAVMLFLNQGSSVNNDTRERLSYFIRNLNEKENILTPEKLSRENRDRIAAGTMRLLNLPLESSDDLLLACAVAMQNYKGEKGELDLNEILKKDYSSPEEFITDMKALLQKALQGGDNGNFDPFKATEGAVADAIMNKCDLIGDAGNWEKGFQLNKDIKEKIAIPTTMQLYEKIITMYKATLEQQNVG